MAPPFKSLRFLYLGSAGFDADLAYYRQVLGADRVWQFEAFESQVAAVRLGDGPCLVFNDPSGNPLAIFEDQRPQAMERAFLNADDESVAQSDVPGAET